MNDAILHAINDPPPVLRSGDAVRISDIECPFIDSVEFRGSTTLDGHQVPPPLSPVQKHFLIYWPNTNIDLEMPDFAEHQALRRAMQVKKRPAVQAPSQSPHIPY